MGGRHEREGAARALARRGVAVLAIAAAVATGCAVPGGRSGGSRPPADRVAASLPEPDPACRATVQQPLRANGLEQVTVKVTVTPEGKLSLVEFLAPALSPTAAAELRAAYGSCLWKPGLTPSGEPAESSTVLMFHTH